MRIFKLVVLLMLAMPPVTHGSGLPYYTDSSLTPVFDGPVSDHRLGDFQLLNQLGDAISGEGTAGRIRIVNFFFATCPGICPMTMFNLKRVQDAIEEEAALLMSYSVTPNIDTPEKLAGYASTRGIESNTWQLLTGDDRQITALAELTFFAVLEDNVKPGAMAHTEKAFLVDREGFIRGVYNATSAADVMRLVEDLETLL